MDNEYTYYTGQEPSGNQNMNGNMNGNMNQNMNGAGDPRKPKKGMPKWAKIGCVALAFGVVAGAAFQTTSFVSGKLLGTNSAKSSSKTVESAKLTTSGDSSVVTTDVTKIVNNAMPSVVSITNMSVQQVQSFFGGMQEQQSESA